MAFEGNQAGALLSVALEAFRNDVQPRLAKDQRYLGAMIANALAIAGRTLEGGAGKVEDDVLRAIYGDRKASLEQLAADIRHGRLGGSEAGEVRGLVKALVVAELRQRNPRHLKSRGVV